jgi:hypothetical protein
MFWDTILIILTFYSGYKLGKFIQIIELRLAVRKLAKDNDINLDQLIGNSTIEENPNVLLLEAEHIDNVILIYDRINNEFICQAESMEEAALKFNQRKNNMLGALTIDDKNVYFVKGKISNNIMDALNEN